MALLDEFDPKQFEVGGGLFGRLQSLIQGPIGQSSVPAEWPTPQGVQLALRATPARQPPDRGQAQNIRIGDYWMPQFGRPEPQPEPTVPGLGDRLGAAFQNWARTPVGNPFAALANGLAGYEAGRGVDQPVATPDRADLLRQAVTVGDQPPVSYVRRRSRYGR